jgi:hypothetical protein
MILWKYLKKYWAAKHTYALMLLVLINVIHNKTERKKGSIFLPVDLRAKSRPTARNLLLSAKGQWSAVTTSPPPAMPWNCHSPVAPGLPVSNWPAQAHATWLPPPGTIKSMQPPWRPGLQATLKLSSISTDAGELAHAALQSGSCGCRGGREAGLEMGWTRMARRRWETMITGWCCMDPHDGADFPESMSLYKPYASSNFVPAGKD